MLADEPTGNLDSQTGAEIVDLLTSLSAEHRRSVIPVTHDHEVAGKAQRILRMHDGRLREDAGEATAAQLLPAS